MNFLFQSFDRNQFCWVYLICRNKRVIIRRGREGVGGGDILEGFIDVDVFVLVQ